MSEHVRNWIAPVAVSLTVIGVGLACGDNSPVDQHTFACAEDGDCASGFICMTCGDGEGRCVTDLEEATYGCSDREWDFNPEPIRASRRCRPLCGDGFPSCQSDAQCEQSFFSEPKRFCVCDANTGDVNKGATEGGSGSSSSF